jgi:hypothetical protein
MKKFDVIYLKFNAYLSLKKTLYIAVFALSTAGAFAQGFEDDVNDEVATPISGNYVALSAAVLLGSYFCFKGKFADKSA